MKSDLYTKLVLTVIAVSLSVIAVQITTKVAYAQVQGLLFSPSGALMVLICDPVGPLGQRSPPRQNSCRSDMMLKLRAIRMNDGSVRRSIQE